MNVDTWNVLHDGAIEAVEGGVPGDVKLWVEIPYLCGYLPTQAEHIFVTLVDCRRFEYRPYEDSPVVDLPAIAALSLDILSAEIVDGLVSIACGDRSYGGQLVAQYSEARISTAGGRSLSQAEVEEAAARYWSHWERKNARRPSESS